MAGKKMDLGPIGQHVAAAVRAVREQRRLSYAELSRRLDDLGRPLPPLGLRRMEAGERRIDVDDLATLALALEVSPLALLLPRQASAVVPGGEVYAHDRLWDWGIGKWPLWGDEVTFVRDSHPDRWAQMMGDRDRGDALALKLAAGEIRHGVEGEVQNAVRSTGATDGVKESD